MAWTSGANRDPPVAEATITRITVPTTALMPLDGHFFSAIAPPAMATPPAARKGNSGLTGLPTGDTLDETENEQASDSGQQVPVVQSGNNAIHC